MMGPVPKVLIAAPMAMKAPHGAVNAVARVAEEARQHQLPQEEQALRDDAGQGEGADIAQRPLRFRGWDVAGIRHAGPSAAARHSAEDGSGPGIVLHQAQQAPAIAVAAVSAAQHGRQRRLQADDDEAVAHARVQRQTQAADVAEGAERQAGRLAQIKQQFDRAACRGQLQGNAAHALVQVVPVSRAESASGAGRWPPRRPRRCSAARRRLQQGRQPLRHQWRIARRRRRQPARADAPLAFMRLQERALIDAAVDELRVIDAQQLVSRPVAVVEDALQRAKIAQRADSPRPAPRAARARGPARPFRRSGCRRPGGR